MATELELLEHRVRELENILAKVLPLVPIGIADPVDTEAFNNEKERLRSERPDRTVVTEPNTRPTTPTTGRIT